MATSKRPDSAQSGGQSRPAKDSLGRRIDRQATIACPICGDLIGAGRGKAAIVGHLMGKLHAIPQAEANRLGELLFGSIRARQALQEMLEESRAVGELETELGSDVIQAWQRRCWGILSGADEEPIREHG